MATRKVKNAKDFSSGELIYFKGHAKATYMSDGTTVEDAINNIEVGPGTDLSDYATKEELNGKQDTIADLEVIRQGAAKGATALQSYTEQYKGTVTGVKVNGSTKNPSNGVVDLGTVITSHQDISGKQDTITDLEAIRQGAAKGATAIQHGDLSTVATSGSYNDLTEKPTIPNAVSESTVSDWGFAKSSALQTKAEDSSVVHKTGNETITGAKTFNSGVNFLGSGDSNAVTLSTNTRINVNGTNKTVLGFGSGTFYINHGDYSLLLRGKDTRPTYNSTTLALSSDVSGKQDTITDLEVIRQGAAKGATALQSYTEQYKGTVTGVKINGTTKNPSNGIVDLGTVITSHQDISGKQDKLVSGTNIKTINGTSILGSGNITIEGGTGNSDANVQAVDTTETLDDVETNTYVKYVAQTLTEEQKAQVRENIGVNSSNDNIDYVKKEELSEVAISGSYNDLLDKPTQITKPILEAPFNNTVAGFTDDGVMKHGVIYVSMINNIETITIENFEAPDKDVVEYVWHFKTSTMPTLSLPSYIYWANGELPEIEDYTVYELSITATRDYSTDDYIYKAVLVPFKTI